MTTFSILPVGYDIDLLRNGGNFILRDPAGLAAGVYFIEVSEARDDQGVRRTIQKFENAASGAVFTRAVATTGWSSFIEVSATTAITLSGSQTGGLAQFASDTTLSQATAAGVRTAAGGIREPLTANRTYYVSTTGSDSADGLTVSTPFETMAKAWATILTLDLQGYTVTVSLAAGTYTSEFLASGSVVGQAAVGSIVFQGAGATTIISTSGAFSCIRARDGAQISIKDMKLTNSGTGYGAYATSYGRINLAGGTEFGACGGGHIRANRGGLVSSSFGAANYTISGNAPYHFYANGGDINMSSITITLTGTPVFTYFAYSTAAGALITASHTYSGAATGQRYLANINAVINTFGGGASYFPGDVAGATATGGQYT